MPKSKVDTTARSLISTARDLYASLSFKRHGANHRFKGVYRSYSEALAAVPAQAFQGFDHKSVAEFFIDTHFVFQPADYPVLFWLSQILEPRQLLFDYGGGVGQSFYLYQNYLRFPEGMRWMVFDLEALVEAGRRLGEEKKAQGLGFTTNFHDAQDATILLTTGALHYIEPDLSASLAELPKAPKHVLVNRVPMYEGEPYYTVQHSEHSFVPNKIMNLDAFVLSMQKLNYEKVDQWYLPRSVRIPFHPECFVSSYRGFYFRLKDDPSARSR